MAKTAVVWTDNAKQDLSEIGSYIAKDSRARAVDFTQRLFDSTVQLEDFPLSGPPCPEDPTCRQLVLDGYRIIYEVTKERSDVLTVISPGLDATRMLKRLKTPVTK